MADADREKPGDDSLVAPHLKRAAARRGERRKSPRSPARHLALMTLALTVILYVSLALAPDPVELRPAQSDVTGALQTQQEAAAPAIPDEEPVAAWVRVERPLELFGLESPELGASPHRYEAARHPAGGGRDDVLVFGEFGTDVLHLRLSAYRTGSEAPAPGTFFVDLVRRAGESGLAVTKSAVAGALATKFGAAEVADVLLAGQGRERACLAFRLLSTGLRLSGWLCGTQARPADRALLACLVDRFDLVAAADDAGLAASFAKAEQQRGKACAGPHLMASGRKTTWLDAAAKPPALKSLPKQR